MNARKYAWQILHDEIRRRAAPDEGLDFHPQLENMGEPRGTGSHG